MSSEPILEGSNLSGNKNLNLLPSSDSAVSEIPSDSFAVAGVTNYTNFAQLARRPEPDSEPDNSVLDSQESTSSLDYRDVALRLLGGSGSFSNLNDLNPPNPRGDSRLTNTNSTSQQRITNVTMQESNSKTQTQKLVRLQPTMESISETAAQIIISESISFNVPGVANSNHKIQQKQLDDSKLAYADLNFHLTQAQSSRLIVGPGNRGLRMNNKVYELYQKIGQGGFGRVYEVGEISNNPFNINFKQQQLVNSISQSLSQSQYQAQHCPPSQSQVPRYAMKIITFKQASQLCSILRELRVMSLFQSDKYNDSVIKLHEFQIISSAGLTAQSHSESESNSQQVLKNIIGHKAVSGECLSEQDFRYAVSRLAESELRSANQRQKGIDACQAMQALLQQNNHDINLNEQFNKDSNDIDLDQDQVNFLVPKNLEHVPQSHLGPLVTNNNITDGTNDNVLSKSESNYRDTTSQNNQRQISSDNHTDIFGIQGIALIRMELADTTLHRHLFPLQQKSPRLLSIGDRENIIMQISKAVNAVHDLCILHADVKLQNFLVIYEKIKSECSDSESESNNTIVDYSRFTLKIADFGTARIVSGESGTTMNFHDLSEVQKQGPTTVAQQNQNPDHLNSQISSIINPELQSQTQEIDVKLSISQNLPPDFDKIVLPRRVGTVPYMAPEIVAPKGRQIGRAVDIWSLGICIYLILYREFPDKHVGDTATEILVNIRDTGKKITFRKDYQVWKKEEEEKIINQGNLNQNQSDSDCDLNCRYSNLINILRGSLEADEGMRWMALEILNAVLSKDSEQSRAILMQKRKEQLENLHDGKVIGGRNMIGTTTYMLDNVKIEIQGSGSTSSYQQYNSNLNNNSRSNESSSSQKSSSSSSLKDSKKFRNLKIKSQVIVESETTVDADYSTNSLNPQTSTRSADSRRSTQNGALQEVVIGDKSSKEVNSTTDAYDHQSEKLVNDQYSTDVTSESGAESEDYLHNHRSVSLNTGKKSDFDVNTSNLSTNSTKGQTESKRKFSKKFKIIVILSIILFLFIGGGIVAKLICFLMRRDLSESSDLNAFLPNIEKDPFFDEDKDMYSMSYLNHIDSIAWPNQQDYFLSLQPNFKKYCSKSAETLKLQPIFRNEILQIMQLDKFKDLDKSVKLHVAILHSWTRNTFLTKTSPVQLQMWRVLIHALRSDDRRMMQAHGALIRSFRRVFADICENIVDIPVVKRFKSGILYRLQGIKTLTESEIDKKYAVGTKFFVPYPMSTFVVTDSSESNKNNGYYHLLNSDSDEYSDFANSNAVKKNEDYDAVFSGSENKLNLFLRTGLSKDDYNYLFIIKVPDNQSVSNSFCALDIQQIAQNSNEKEVLIDSYTAFKVESIEKTTTHKRKITLVAIDKKEMEGMGSGSESDTSTLEIGEMPDFFEEGK